MNAPVRNAPIAAAKLQHHVIYVSDLRRSKDFYTKLFDLQFSALNHPDSSAAMRLAQMEMHFFSFGFYHHDICLVKHHKLKIQAVRNGVIEGMGLAFDDERRALSAMLVAQAP